jgi:RHS repeat-associated protein
MRRSFKQAKLILSAVLTAIVLPAVVSSATAGRQLPGSIEGKADVSLSGSATYTIPLVVPPGTAGTVPKLSFAYDSQSSVGPLGAGWSIGGLSRITRGSKNLRTDGVIRGVHLDGDDALYLDGQRLLPSSPGCSTSVKTVTFVKEADDQTIVEAACGANGFGSFVVRTKAGLSLGFGETQDSQIKLDDGTFLLWVCDRIEDSTGNFILFSYSQNGTGDYNIKSIDYTGNKNNGQKPYANITFNYDTVSQASTAFIAGYQIRRDSRLASIVSTVGGAQANRYDLKYNDVQSINRFVLTSITESGEGASADTYPSTSFTYSTPADPVSGSIACPQPSGSPSVWCQQDSTGGGYGGIVNFGLSAADNVAVGYKIVDISVGGAAAFPQIVYGADIRGIPERFGFKNDGHQFTPYPQLAPPTPFAVDGVDVGAVVMDLDGDKQPYIIAPAAGLAFANVWKFTGTWTPQSNVKIPMSSDGVSLPRLVKGNIFGHHDGTSDLLWYDIRSNNSGTLINQGPGRGLTEAGAALPGPLDDTARTLDANCDGVDELAYFGNSKGLTYSYVSGSWRRAQNSAGNNVYDLPPQAAASSPFAIKRVGSAPGTAGKCPLIVVAQENGFSGAFDADPQAGWKPDTAHDPSKTTPPILFVDKDGHDLHAQILEFNHQTELFAAWQIDTSRTVQYAFLSVDTGYTDNSANVLPLPQANPVLGTQGQTTPIAYLGDLNGDGYPDLVFFSNNRSVANAIYLYDPNGAPGAKWRSQSNSYLPPIVFARQGQQDLGVRLVNLHGAAGLSDIIYRQDKSGTTVNPPGSGSQQNIGQGWLGVTGLAPPVPLAADYNLSNAIQFVDLDGDGYVDLLYSLKRKSGSTDANFYKNIQDPNTPDPIAPSRLNRMWDTGSSAGFKPPAVATFGDETIGDLGVRLADLDGDGLPDLIFARLESNGTVTRGWCRNDGTKWLTCDQTGGFAPPADLFFVVMPGAAGNSRAYSMQTDMQVFDVDGDGLPDLVFRFTDPRSGSEKQGVCLNTGSGWPAFSDCQKITVPVALDKVETDPTISIQYIDINGDGFVDIVWSKADTSSTTSVTYLGTGARSGPSWQTASQWNIPIPVISSTPGDPGFRLIDINGEGLPDILFYPDGKQATAFFNTGYGWAPLSSAGYGPPRPLSNANGTDTGSRIIDLNGDGLPDFVQSYVDDTGKSTTGVWLNENRRADVLTKVVDGLGVETDICYQTLQELGSTTSCNTSFFKVRDAGFDATAVYAGCEYTASFPILCATPSAYVAREITVLEGHPSRTLKFSYSYSGLRFDARSKQSLGFESRTAFDETKQTTTKLTFLQFDPSSASKDIWNRGLIANNTVLSPTKKILSKVDATWARTVKALPPNSGSSGTNYTNWTIAQIESRTETYDLLQKSLGTQDDTYEYDAFLNVVKSVSTRNDQTSIEVVSRYSNDSDPNHWLLGRLIKSTVTKIGDEGKANPEVRNATFAYDQKSGLLVEEITNAGDPKQVKASYVRDVFGNVVESTFAAANEPARKTKKVFDANGRFLLTETDALGHSVKKTYSATLGSILTQTDVNDLQTSFGYDAFGRMTLRTDPSGVKTTVVYTASASPGCPASDGTHSTAAYSTVSTSASLPAVTALFDCRGRQIDRSTSGFSGNPSNERTVSQHTDYDVYGRVVRITQPHFESETPITVEKEYDVLDRVVRISRSGAVTTYAYDGTQSTVTDPLGRQTVTQTNARRLPLKVVDPSGGTIAFAYDAGDRVKEIDVSFLDARGVRRTAKTTHEYDSVGHRKSSVDPDMGTWHYEYNAFGNLVSQTDAKSQVTKLTYDLLDRPVARDAPDRKDKWEYDTATGKGIGLLKSVSSTSSSVPNGYSEELQYDKLAREKTRTFEVGRQRFVSVVDRDDFGRITRSEAPDNFAVKYSYDTSGFLDEVKDAATGKVYWKAEGIDALGRLTAELYGNGAKTTHTFDGRSGFLAHIETIGSNGDHIQDTSLDYDLVGDVLDRQSVVDGHHRRVNYTYDELQRLSSSQRASEKPLKMGYDGAGSIAAKPTLGEQAGSGSFDYDYRHPFHAVKSISATNGDEEVFVYDENGNRRRQYTFGPDGTEKVSTVFDYTSDNRVAAVQRTLRRWTFEYTADGQMFRQKDAYGVETLSIGAYARIKEPLSISTLHRHFLSNGEGVFAVVDVVAFDAPSSGSATRLTHYLHKDHLGSVVRISDEKGKAGAWLSYDPWGFIKKPPIKPDHWNRGYTGHQEIVDALLVHMNGRVYDPGIASFTSPDLATQALTDTRTFNRYAYVFDNPLKYTDPTGYWPHIGGFIGGIVSGIVGGVVGIAQDIGQAVASGARWVEQNWKEVAIITAAVGVTVLSGGTASPILVGLLSGAVAGGLGSALYGGSLNDVLMATFKGAVLGVISAGIGDALSAGSWSSILAKGDLGGIESVAQGGNYWKGFGLAALSDLSPDVNAIGGFDGAAILRIGAQAALSGTIAALEGGKFGNGAMWGAFAQLQNDSNTYRWAQDIQSSPLAAAVGAVQTVVQDSTALIAEINSLPVITKGIFAAAIVSSASKLVGLDGQFAYAFEVGFARNQMSDDPFAAGIILFTPSNAIKWSDSQAFGYQGVGLVAFGAYSYQLAPTANFGGSFGFQYQGAFGFSQP